MKFLRNRKTTLAALILASSFTVVGCGGSNASTGGGPTGPVVQNPFAGRFSGQAALSPGQTAFLQYTVGSAQAITGTLNVVGGGVGQAVQVFIPNGLVQLQGTVDFGTGTFVLNGNLGGFPISIAGTVNGPFTISYQGQTFSGGPGGGQGGGGGDIGDAQLITSGTLSNFLFTPGQNFNGPTLVQANLSAAGSINRNTATNNFLVVALSQTQLNPIRIDGLTLGIFTAGSDNPTTKFYPILTNPAGDGSIVSLSVNEGLDPNPTQAWVQGAGTTGGITINSISQDSANLTFDFANLVPNPEVAGNEAVGTFSTSGTVDVQFGPILP